MKKIEILGAKKCSKCKRLENMVRHFLEKHKISAEVTKVEDLDTMVSYGALTTPGIVVDGKLKAAGRIPREEELKQWLMPHSKE